MNRALPFAFFLGLFTATLLLGGPTCVQAQSEEARLLFERGNQHFARGMRARGVRRQRELEEARDAYVAVLRLGARTRNVIFNLAVTLQELGREPEAFNYFAEYLRSFELSPGDRAEGQERIDAIRPRVAVLTITSTPAGADVRVDRRDLPVRGQTPLDLALEPGEHTVFLQREGYEEATTRATPALGRSIPVAVELVGQPVPVQVIAPAGRLTLDDEEIVAGRAVPVPPGPHLVRLEIEGMPPIERAFEVPAGGSPMVLELGAGGSTTTGLIAIRVDAESRAFLDGLPVGQGARMEVPTAPGDHVLRVEAPGRTEATHRLTLRPGQTLSLDVTLGERANPAGVYAGRGVFGILASLGLVGSAVLLGTTGERTSAWNAAVGSLGRQTDPGTYTRLREQALALADEVDALNLATDIALTLTAALGTAAIVFLAIDPGSDREPSVEVALRPAIGGGTLALRGTWGDR